MRMVDPPIPGIPAPPGTLVLERGPFTLEDERELLKTYVIGVIVSKNSGGDATYAKIRAARELALPGDGPASSNASGENGSLAWRSANMASQTPLKSVR